MSYAARIEWQRLNAKKIMATKMFFDDDWLYSRLTVLDVPILHSLHHHYYFHKGLRVVDYPANVDDPNHPSKSKWKPMPSNLLQLFTQITHEMNDAPTCICENECCPIERCELKPYSTSPLSKSCGLLSESSSAVRKRNVIN